MGTDSLLRSQHLGEKYYKGRALSITGQTHQQEADRHGSARWPGGVGEGKETK